MPQDWRKPRVRETFVCVKRHSAMALCAAAILLACTPAAAADTRFVAPGGFGGAPCAEVSPCSLTTALTGPSAVAQNGDTVTVAPGTYALPGGLSVNTPNVHIVGAPGTKPVFQVGSFLFGVGFGPSAGGSELRGVRVEALNGAAPPVVGAFPVPAVSAASPVTLRDIEVSAPLICVQLTGAGSRIEDARLVQTGVVGPFYPFGVFADNAVVRNVDLTASNAANAGALLGGSGLSVDQLTVKGGGVVFGSSADLLSALPAGAPAVMRRSRIEAPAPGLVLTKGPLVTDTVVSVVAGPSPFGPQLGTVAVASAGAKLRNVTAIATGAGSTGLRVGGAPAPGPNVPTSVKNSILRGDGKDVLVQLQSPAVPPLPALLDGDLTITNSNFRTSEGALNAASGGNQSGDPLFANATTGDYHLLAGSPAIDAGVDDPDLGAVDIDGNPRQNGAAVDIGAFEFVPPPPPPAPPSGPLPGPSTPGGGGLPDQPLPPPDRTRPALSLLTVTNKVFRVGSQATTIAARAKAKPKTKVGTTFRYALSEGATVRIAIERTTTGRRSGSSCVAPTKRNVKAKKCTRYVAVGAISGGTKAAGGNSTPFSGRIGRKALSPDSYRAVLTANDAAGNKSPSKTVAFTIVAR
jgi:hypothetical protein